MTDKYMISIIIPNYNGSKFIGRCIESVLSQKEKRVEIIIVDDGSKDDSKSIIEKYRSQNNNIKPVYKENGGVSSARNEGIKHATGKYTLFLDSDDELEENSLSVMLDNIGDNDELVFSYLLYDPETGTSVKKRQMETEVDGDTLRKKLFFYITRTQFASPWNKLIKTELLHNNNVCFPNGVKVGEDYIFNLRVTKFVEKVKFSNLFLYKYYENTSSVTHKLDMNRWKDQALTVRETYSLSPERNEFESEFIVKRLYNTYMAFGYILNRKQTVDVIKKYINTAYKDIDISNVKGKLAYRILVNMAEKKKYNLVYCYLWFIDHMIRLKHRLNV